MKDEIEISKKACSRLFRYKPGSVWPLEVLPGAWSSRPQFIHLRPGLLSPRQIWGGRTLGLGAQGDSENVSFLFLCPLFSCLPPPAPPTGYSCRSPQGRSLLLTSAPNRPLAVARALGEPKPARDLQLCTVRASLLLPRAIPARPRGASPCPAKRALLLRTRPGPGAPHPGAPRRPGPSLTAPPPRGGPRKDPEGNSRLSAQQPKAGRVSRRAGLGPDNDARGSPRPPTLTLAPHPQPATLEQLPAQPYALDARHPRPQLPSCICDGVRASTRRACPPALPTRRVVDAALRGVGGVVRGGWG